MRSEQSDSLTIRIAAADDAPAVGLLAGLDSVPALAGDVLLAELGGAPLAAISLTSGAVAADPFQLSSDAVRLLRLRRYQLLHQGADVAPAQSLLRRLVPGTAR